MECGEDTSGLLALVAHLEVRQLLVYWAHSAACCPFPRRVHSSGEGDRSCDVAQPCGWRILEDEAEDEVY